MHNRLTHESTEQEYTAIMLLVIVEPTHFLCILHVYPQQTVGTDAAIIMAYRYTLQEQIEAWGKRAMQQKTSFKQRSGGGAALKPSGQSTISVPVTLIKN